MLSALRCRGGLAYARRRNCWQRCIAAYYIVPVLSALHGKKEHFEFNYIVSHSIKTHIATSALAPRLHQALEMRFPRTRPNSL